MFAAFLISFWTVIDIHFTMVIRYAANNPRNYSGPIRWFNSDSDKPPLDEDALKKLEELKVEQAKRDRARPWELDETQKAAALEE